MPLEVVEKYRNINPAFAMLLELDSLTYILRHLVSLSHSYFSKTDVSDSHWPAVFYRLNTLVLNIPCTDINCQNIS